MSAVFSYVKRVFAAVLLIVFFCPAFAADAHFTAVRTWPSSDYTRVTLEHDGAVIKTRHFKLSNPDRLVVDIEHAQSNDILKTLPSQINKDDPYIKQVRTGQFNNDTVRLVFELKTKVAPQVFSLPAVAGKFKKRLVIDVYPETPVDPISSLIAKGEWKTDGDDQKPVAAAPAKQDTKKKKKKPEKKKDDDSDKLVLKRMYTIVIDPGHGGEDPGAIGPTGKREKDVVLAIGKKLRSKIEKEKNMRVVMTRDSDFFVPLGRRVQKARAVKADLFISVHADAFSKSSASGASVFALSERGATSTMARMLAKHENSADQIGGVYLAKQDRQVASVLLDLSTSAQIRDSLKLGSAVLKKIGGINRLHKERVEQAGFAVLKAPDIPSILVETAFISNPEEEKKLSDPDHQDKLADAILGGVKQYFKSTNTVRQQNMF